MKKFFGLVTAIAAITLSAPAHADPTTPVPAPGGGSQHSQGGFGSSGGGGGGYSPSAPIQQAPVQQAPIQQAPVQQAPVQQAPVQQAPVQQAPVQQVPDYTPPIKTPDYTAPKGVQQSTDAPLPSRTAAEPSAPAQVTTPEPTKVVVETTPVLPSAAAPALTPSAVAPSASVSPDWPTPSAAPPSGASTPSNAPLPSAQPSAAVLPSAQAPAQSSAGPTVIQSKPGTEVTSASVGTSVLNGSPVLVAPPLPNAVAPEAAVLAAKAAPAPVINVAAPPAPDVKINFNTQVNLAVQNNNIVQNNIQINNVTEFRPARWDYLDYDDYHRPVIYNPIDVDLTYRYFYDGDYRTVYVPHGGRIVLVVPIVGVFPFTAVGIGGYVYTGYFNGGCWNDDGPPPYGWHPWAPVVYNDVDVYVPSVDRSVVINRVTVVGHDDARPYGQQDQFMLDGGRLAWGQTTDGRNGGRIEVNKSQATPGVGPTDDGGPIIKTTLTAAQKPIPTNYTPWLLGALGVVILGAALGGTWVWRHPKGAHAGAPPPYDPPTGRW